MSGLEVVRIMIAIAVAASLGFFSSILNLRMIDQVNAKLPAEQRFSTIGWHVLKFRSLLAEYRRLYPSGDLDRRLLLVSAISVGMVPALALLIGFHFLLGVFWLCLVGGIVVWVTFHR